MLKLSGPLTRHNQVLFAPVVVSNRFYFIFFARGDDGLGRIVRPHKVGAYFGIQAVFLVGSLSWLTERECGRADYIIDNLSSWTPVGEVIRYVVSLKLALHLRWDQFLPSSYSPVEYLASSKKLYDLVVGVFCHRQWAYCCLSDAWCVKDHINWLHRKLLFQFLCCHSNTTDLCWAGSQLISLIDQFPAAWNFSSSSPSYWALRYLLLLGSTTDKYYFLPLYILVLQEWHEV